MTAVAGAGRFGRLGAADAGRLQELLDRCSDYYELHEGCATPVDAGVHELSAVPPGRSAGELQVFAFAQPAGVLDAMIQLLPGYPDEGVWWIGLLVVAPGLRGRGVGRELLRHAVEAAASASATGLQLLVSVRNPRALKFWASAGFRETGRVCDVAARNGFADTARFMSRDLRRS